MFGGLYNRDNYGPRRLCIENASKPWLLSTEEALLDDAEEKEEFEVEYLEYHPFPGIRSSAADKKYWLQGMYDRYKQMDYSHYQENAPAPQVFVRKILMNECPDYVRVKFLIDLHQLESIALQIGEEKQRKLLKNIQQLQQISKVFDNLEDCLLHFLYNNGTWKENIVQEKSTAVRSSPSPSTKNILLASVVVKKDTKFSNIVWKISNDLGIWNFIDTADIQGGSTGLWWPQEKIGQNMYGADTSDDGSDEVVLYIQFQAISGTITPEQSFRTLLGGIKYKSSMQQQNPVTYVLVKRINNFQDKDEDIGNDDIVVSMTSEHYQPLWVPMLYTDHLERIGKHVRDGEGEVFDLRRRLFQGNTDSGNIKIDILRFELEYAKSLVEPRDRFCATLALTVLVLRDAGTLFDETNHPGELYRTIRKLARVWRKDLLLLDNDSIGIRHGLEDGTQHRFWTYSKILLYRFLQRLSDGLQALTDTWDEADYGGLKHDVKFHWKPKSGSDE